MTKSGEKIVFTAAGCNRGTRLGDWFQINGQTYFAYAAHSQVAILDPLKREGVRVTLAGHGQASVTALAVIQDCLISGASNGSLTVWKCEQNPFEKKQWQILYQVTLKNSSISTVTSVNTSQDSGWLVVAYLDGNVHLIQWKRVHDHLSFVNEGLQLSHPNHVTPLVAESIHWTLSEHHSIPLLALGGTDGRVRVYTVSNASWTLLVTLPGHQNWVRDITMKSDQNDILLASASQDRVIRVWRLGECALLASAGKEATLRLQLSTQAFMMDVPIVGAEGPFIKRMAALPETVLHGHEDWILGVQFAPGKEQLLLTASADQSLFLWQPQSDQIWFCQSRMGDIDAKTAGFFGARFSSDAKVIVAWHHNGALQVWKREQDQWQQQPSFPGPCGSVEDCAWSPNGSYLSCVSLDQTTRMIAPLKDSQNEKIFTWHEAARAQVHGYDLRCIVHLTQDWIASGADEKVIRVFESTPQFQGLLKAWQGEASLMPTNKVPVSQPALGLTNRATLDMNTTAHTIALNDNDNDTADNMKVEPHSEAVLLASTLWPEQNKLYGHGNEISALASTHCGRLLFSACRATAAAQAEIRCWRVHSPGKVLSLPSPTTAHTLTVTQMRCDPTDKYLLAVSRDRHWSLYQLKEDETCQWIRSALAHARQVHCCAWLNRTHFLTGARDKRIKVWNVESDECLATWQMDDAVTAMDVYGQVLAVGFEQGAIRLLTLSENGLTFTSNALLESASHSDAVMQLRWQPNQTSPLLASVGRDQVIRLTQVDL